MRLYLTHAMSLHPSCTIHLYSTRALRLYPSCALCHAALHVLCVYSHTLRLYASCAMRLHLTHAMRLYRTRALGLYPTCALHHAHASTPNTSSASKPVKRLLNYCILEGGSTSGHSPATPCLGVRHIHFRSPSSPSRDIYCSMRFLFHHRYPLSSSNTWFPSGSATATGTEVVRSGERPADFGCITHER